MHLMRAKPEVLSKHWTARWGGVGAGSSCNFPAGLDPADHMGHARSLLVSPSLSCSVPGALPFAVGNFTEYSDLILWVLLPGCHCKVL